MIRVAMVSPLPPSRSGIADYSAELARALAPHCDLTLYSDRPAEPDLGVPWRPVADLGHLADWDVALYQMGNNTEHEFVYQAALRYPGVTVLHDPVIHHFVSAVTEHAGNVAGFIREMRYSHGAAATQRMKQLGGPGIAASRYPLTGRLIDFSLAIIVHSEEAARNVREVRPEAGPVVIPHLVAPLPLKRAKARKALWLPDDLLVIASFGNVTPEKRIASVVAALEQAAPKLPDWRYLVVGQDDGALAGILATASPTVAARIQALGRVAWEDFGRYLTAADFVVNLRWPTLGETSGAVLRAAAQGQPVIVSGVGAFRELPESFAIQAPADEGEVLALAQAITDLGTNPAKRQAMSAAARGWAAKTLAPDTVARQYLAVLESALMAV